MDKKYGITVIAVVAVLGCCILAAALIPKLEHKESVVSSQEVGSSKVEIDAGMDKYLIKSDGTKATIYSKQQGDYATMALIEASSAENTIDAIHELLKEGREGADFKVKEGTINGNPAWIVVFAKHSAAYPAIMYVKLPTGAYSEVKFDTDDEAKILDIAQNLYFFEETKADKRSEMSAWKNSAVYNGEKAPVSYGTYSPDDQDMTSLPVKDYNSAVELPTETPQE